MTNPVLHFHCVVLDGVFATMPAGAVVLHPATGIETEAIAAVQATVRRRLLGSFVRRGRLERDDAHTMAQWAHGGVLRRRVGAHRGQRPRRSGGPRCICDRPLQGDEFTAAYVADGPVNAGRLSP